MSDTPRAEQCQGDLLPRGDVVASDPSPAAEESVKSRLDELTRQAVEDGLYDVDADAYRDALAQARKQS